MRVIGCLAWYEESPTWLAACAASTARLCDHLVAVDGAYALFPEASRSSGLAQQEAVLEACEGVGIGCTLHVPPAPWYGNEVEKRRFLFQAAALVAEPGVDWVFVIDADELVSEVPGDLREQLAATDRDVAAGTLWWRDDLHASERLTQAARAMHVPQRGANPGHRHLFRALPNLRVERAHYVVVGDRDGRTVYLRGRGDIHELEPALDLPGLRVEHRHAFRDHDRMLRAGEFYELRDRLGVEALHDTYMEGPDGQPVLVERSTA